MFGRGNWAIAGLLKKSPLGCPSLRPPLVWAAG